ncbi:hypothetical protein ACFYO1_34355 [Nocardia sp. NPDC006044]|uniref:iron-sulfur cluster-binding protein n=1 Tax=Nocardia sp. NPDC006044 TaxID=3364306 RepID=UPI0036A36CE2
MIDLRPSAPVREDAEVIARTDVPHYTLVELAAPRIADRLEPGQFVSVPAPPDQGPPGRWMLSPSAVRRSPSKAGVLRFIVNRGNTFRTAFDTLRPGDRVALIGALGCPVRLSEAPGPVLIVAVGHGVAFACHLAEELARRDRPCAVHVFFPEPVTETAAPWVADVPDRAAITAAAMPDSQHWTPRLRALLDAVRPGQVVVAAATPIARSIAGECRSRTVPCLVLTEPFMACGIGLCLTCAVPVRDGELRQRFARACVEGPAFAADAIDWELLAAAGRPE